MRDAADLPVIGDTDIAALASLLADPARCAVLLALDDGRALPASVLAAEAGVSRSTASSHLAKLTAAELLSVEKHGRNRYYRLAGREVGDLIEQLARLAPRRPVRSLTQGTRAARLRSARTCYDHVAGRLGVDLMSAMLARGILIGGDGRYHPDGHDTLSSPGRDVHYELTASGRDLLDAAGMELPASTRPLVRYCVDWTEQRHHLAGALGRAVLDRLLGAGWVTRTARHRALTVTLEGRGALERVFGVQWQD